MIIVTVDPCGIRIKGHAGYAPAGKDIVCAAVSTLACTLVKSINELTDSRIFYMFDPGDIRIDFENLSESGKLLVDSFFLGICGVIEEYGDYVKIGEGR